MIKVKIDCDEIRLLDDKPEDREVDVCINGEAYIPREVLLRELAETPDPNAPPAEEALCVADTFFLEQQLEIADLLLWAEDFLNKQGKGEETGYQAIRGMLHRLGLIGQEYDVATLVLLSEEAESKEEVQP